jgi:spermidine synthase
MFHNENYDVVKDPRTTVVIDDGRHFIRTTDQKFDVITSDPIDPWVKGCASLNTVEYYQMAKDHLKPGGVMSLWIPFYEENMDGAKSILATFFKVFPNGILFSNDYSDNSGLHGFDAVLFGINDPSDTAPIDIDALEARLNRDDYAKVAASIKEVGFGKPGISRLSPGPNPMIVSYPPAVALLATYAGQATDLKAWADADPVAQINDDMNLRLQYLAGMWLDTPASTADEILSGTPRSIMRYFRFPDERFIGSKQHVDQLKYAMNELSRPVDLPVSPEPAAPAAGPDAPTPTPTAPATPSVAPAASQVTPAPTDAAASPVSPATPASTPATTPAAPQ